jgi:hypothetical protein
MGKRQKLKRMLTRFADFIIGFVIACLVITLGRLAFARGIDDEVNAHIKEEFIRMDIAQKRAAMNLPDPHKISALQNEEWSQGKTEDAQLGHSDDISPSEQSQYMERPRAGFRKVADPLDSIEEKIVEKQAYALYREHYRSALKAELLSRAHSIGIQPTSDMANEVTARAVDSTETPQN